MAKGQKVCRNRNLRTGRFQRGMRGSVRTCFPATGFRAPRGRRPMGRRNDGPVVVRRSKKVPSTAVVRKYHAKQPFGHKLYLSTVYAPDKSLYSAWLISAPSYEAAKGLAERYFYNPSDPSYGEYGWWLSVDDAPRWDAETIGSYEMDRWDGDVEWERRHVKPGHALWMGVRTPYRGEKTVYFVGSPRKADAEAKILFEAEQDYGPLRAGDQLVVRRR